MSFKPYIRPGSGASDWSAILHDAAAFCRLIEALAAPFRDAGIAKVACIEGRGFLLGPAVAYVLGAGVAPLRQTGRLKTLSVTYSAQYIDYTGTLKTLEIAGDAVAETERVLLVDDWVETGETLKAATGLIECCGGEVAGISVLMDGTTEIVRRSFTRYGFHRVERVAANDRF